MGHQGLYLLMRKVESRRFGGWRFITIYDVTMQSTDHWQRYMSCIKHLLRLDVFLSWILVCGDGADKQSILLACILQTFSLQLYFDVLKVYNTLVSKFKINTVIFFHCHWGSEGDILGFRSILDRDAQWAALPGWLHQAYVQTGWPNPWHSSTLPVPYTQLNTHTLPPPS